MALKNPGRVHCGDNRRVIFLRTARYTTEIPSVFGVVFSMMIPVDVSIYRCNACAEETNQPYDFQGEQVKDRTAINQIKRNLQW